MPRPIDFLGERKADACIVVFALCFLMRAACFPMSVAQGSCVEMVCVVWVGVARNYICSWQVCYGGGNTNVAGS